MRADVLKGHLELLLLGVLDDRPAHGYRIIELLRERSGGAFDLPEGTIYPALHRLERSGLLRSGWEEGSARRRRVYEVTPRGRDALRDRRREWTRFAGAVQAVAGA